ncbi:IS1634 family transposase [Thermodesulfovibrio hydrogeniphilus]
MTHLGEPLISKIRQLLKSPEKKVVVDKDKFFEDATSVGHILLGFMMKIGFLGWLRHFPKKVRDLLLAVVLNRIIEPRSKYASVGWIRRSGFMELFDLREEDMHVNEIYRAMDKLYEKMDNVLDDFYKTGAQGTKLLLYDITSVYFEGQGPLGLARYGYSRDGKPDKKQVLLCLCLNENKFPVHFDVIEGNISDKETVKGLISQLKKRYDIKEAVFIGDRGMVTLQNIEYLEREGINYILAMRFREAKKMVVQKGIQLDIFQKELPVTIYISEEEGVKSRYVLCGSEYRESHDRETLESILKRGREALEKVRQMVERGKLRDREKILRRAQRKLTKSGAENYYNFRYKEGRFQIIAKQEAIKKAYDMCGKYILQTTLIKEEDEEIERQYKELQTVEDAFKQLKDFVEIRPIYHYKDRRVRTHIFLCVVAQTVLNRLMDELKEKGWLRESKENSLKKCLDKFYEIGIGGFEIEGEKIRIMSKAKEEHKKILRILGVGDKIFRTYESAREFCRLI